MSVTYVQLIAGTSVGSKVTAVAEKVATDTAEDLKQAAGSFEGDIPGIQPLYHREAMLLSMLYYNGV